MEDAGEMVLPVGSADIGVKITGCKTWERCIVLVESIFLHQYQDVCMEIGVRINQRSLVSCHVRCPMMTDLRDLAHLTLRFWQPIVAMAFLLLMLNVVAGTYRTPYMGSDMTIECRRPMYRVRVGKMIDDKEIIEKLRRRR